MRFHILLSSLLLIAVIEGDRGAIPVQRSLNLSSSNAEMTGDSPLPSDDTHCRLEVGQDARTALCALRQMGSASVELHSGRPRVYIQKIEELEQLRHLAEVQLIFEGKVAAGFTFADGRVTEKWLNPNPDIAYHFAAFSDIDTVTELIDATTERMQTLRDVGVLEVRMPGRLSLVDLDQSGVEAAARSPEWRTGGEGRYGQWGCIVRLKDGRVKDWELNGVPER